MKTFLISYDLGEPESIEDYKRLFAYFKSYGSYAKPLYSLWFIRTNKSVSEVRDEIITKTDWNDRFIVLDVSENDWATKGLSKKITDWMQKYL